MVRFDFFSVPRIVFGRGRFSQLGELAGALGAELGGAVLVVHSLREEGIGAVAGQLAAAKIRAVFFRQKGEPTTGDVDRALAAGREGGCDMVIGIGGGSAIDCAKAVAGLLTNGGAAIDYMEVVGKGRKIVKAAAPWIAVPCTAGTGAEATRNAVIGYPEKHFKASIRSELLLPRVALVDPELGAGVRAEVTASSGMDALCQCIEAYTSSGANGMTDGLAREGIRRAARSLKRAYEEPGDLDAREDMAMAALLSGMALTNAGLGAVHGFAAPLGASFPVPHGTVCAALLPHVMAANVRAMRAAGHPGLGRYVEIGRIVSQGRVEGDEAIDAGIAFVRRLLSDLQIPGLGRFGVDAAAITGQVALAQKSSSMRFNPIVLPAQVLAEILGAAL